VPLLCEVYLGICLTAEEKARKNLSQSTRRMPVDTMKTEFIETACIIKRIHKRNNKNYRIKQTYTKHTTIYTTVKKQKNITTLQHFVTLHPTTLHYTYRHFTSSHLHFTTLSFGYGTRRKNTNMHKFYGVEYYKNFINSIIDHIYTQKLHLKSNRMSSMK